VRAGHLGRTPGDNHAANPQPARQPKRVGRLAEDEKWGTSTTPLLSPAPIEFDEDHGRLVPTCSWICAGLVVSPTCTSIPSARPSPSRRLIISSPSQQQHGHVQHGHVQHGHVQVVSANPSPCSRTGSPSAVSQFHSREAGYVRHLSYRLLQSVAGLPRQHPM
jgi:hypothetical protein